MKVALIIWFSLLSSISYSQEVFNLKHGDIVKNGEIVDSGSEVGNKIVIDSDSKKITYTPKSTEYKERIFKILGEKKDEEVRVFLTTGRNHNGEFFVTVIVDSFYKRIEMLLDEEGKNKMVYTY